ncbi:DUF4365 domain-containing protein [Flavobacterium sp. ZS1P14]|uniref:DUF4365 domain-containing protein n=1 Tax=Flavobacterium sp. ZS1P14 TaxID=3401729 RepID=UPI003AB08DF7
MKRNDEIQIEADAKLELKLMSLFKDNNLEYKQHESNQKKEKGIDFYCHVYNRDNQSQILFFETQNKGTNTPTKVISSTKHPEQGKISFQLELRHVKQYYNELTEALIFIYTDITTDNSYWYSIQIDASIPEKIINKEKELSEGGAGKNKPTIQIYIPSENLLNQENFEKFIKEIQLSRQLQHHKHNSIFELKADYSFIKNEVRDKEILDKAIYTIDLFEGINVIPTNILSKLYPFSGTQQNSYIWDSNLNTDNEEFYDFMNSIQLINGNLEIKGNKYDEGISEKLDKIIKFFSVNCIEHINWAGKVKKSNFKICVHNLLIAKTCNCERCNYDKLNFIEAKKILEENSGKYSLHEKLRRGYTAYSMGNFTVAVEILQEAYKDAEANKKLIFSTIIKYNLVQLRKIISNSYFVENREQLLESLKNANLEINEAEIKINAPHFFDLYKWIKDANFFENAVWSIDNKLEEIKKMSFNDKYGGFHSNEHHQNLLFSFLRLYYFLEFNLIIYNSFNEYKQLTTKVLEGILALYTIKNPNASRYKKFTLTILKMWMFNVKFEDANHLLKKYNINKIKVSDKNATYLELFSYLENLTNSLDIINEEQNEILLDKTELLINNLTLIISRIKFSENHLNNLICKLFLIIEKLDKRNVIPTSALFQLFSHHREISCDNIKKIIFVLKKHHFQHSSAFSYAIKLYVEKSEIKEVETLIFELLDINDFTESDLLSEDNRIETLGYAITFLEINHRETLKKTIIERLNINFDPSFYQLSAIYDLIDYDKDLLDKFINCIPDLTKKDPALRRHFNQNENYRLGQLINLIYKYNVVFTKEMKRLSTYTFQKDFYDWLMDLDGFDYSKFNHYWILEYQTKFYFKAFKKSKILKKEIRKALKKDYIEGVAKIYFNIYN